jgi:threonylcarbamoyladenosine tRNA methylthiotransferase MtaB
MKILLDTVGCRLNQSEIESMARQFRSAGHEIVADLSEADLVVINTCTVTAQAASDSRQKARTAARQGVQDIVLTGCWVTLEPEKARALPDVRKIIPNNRKVELVRDILGLSVTDLEKTESLRKPLPGQHKRTRAFIKAQDGCDNHCTYCVTRLARGRGSSRCCEDVLMDIRSALAGGTKEIVLTGVHLGSWGQDKDGREGYLEDLILTILAETDVPRLRLSSLEPWDLDVEFFSLWQDDRMCRHLHLPLQSGSPGILRRMGRKTTPEVFSNLIWNARKLIPDVAITTDLIVGFPGETEIEFTETFKLIQELNFSGGHVFTFSARPGTPAALMQDQIPFDVRKCRNAQLRAVLSKTGLAYAERFLGKTLDVLWESSSCTKDGLWQLKGHADNNLDVRAHSSNSHWNQIDHVELKLLEGKALWGEIYS